MSKKKSASPKLEQSSRELARFEAVFELMNRHGIAELEWEVDDSRLRVRTPAAFPAPGVAAIPSAAAVGQRPGVAPSPISEPAAMAEPAIKSRAGGLAANQKQILSPFVGTFYRSPSPTGEPYVREGQTVRRGDVLCIIEAMKLMNEIESEHDGKIVRILAENGQPVEFGEPLFTIEL